MAGDQGTSDPRGHLTTCGTCAGLFPDSGPEGGTLVPPSAETVACSGLSSLLSPGSTLGRCQACLTKDSPAQGHGASSPPPRSRPPPPLHPRPPRPQPRQTPVPASPPFWQVWTSRLGAPGDGSPPGMGWRALPGPLPGIA